jgi:transposase
LRELDRTLAVRIDRATGATDIRKGFDSLAALVPDHLGHEPLSGSLFGFIRRDRDRIKILHADTDGLALGYPRLEEGTLRLPAQHAGASVEWKASELAMLLEDIDLSSIQRRRRFTWTAPTAMKR